MLNIPELNRFTHIQAALALFDIELGAQYETNSNVEKMVNDSRDVSQYDIFCAVKGHDLDGRQYIEKAIAKGAALVIAECESASEHGNVFYYQQSEIAVVEFYQLNEYLFELVSEFYQQPQKNVRIIGITGTNGKTTTSQIIASLLDANKHACGIIGTLGAGRVEQLTPINNTTPGATQLLTLLDDFSQQKNSHVAMEVSSHALAQRRVDSGLFDISVFTNLSRDHLDYHQTMAEYADAKFKIFSGKANQIAIINGDDSTAKTWLNASLNESSEQALTHQPVIVYGKCESVKTHQQFLHANKIKLHQKGVTFTLTSHLGSVEINSPLLGEFNVENLLAAMAVLIAEQVHIKDIAKAVRFIKPIAGRMEAFSQENKATAVVDYAHTPDALINALTSCRKHCQNDLWVVFGCGGNRDKGKRALMGAAAEQYANHVVLTNDNPRNEAPEDICNDILAGCKQVKNITVMLDREKAIIDTLSKAKANDVVLLAGKGHEKNIIIGNEVLPYDERALVRSIYTNEVAL